MKRKLLFVLLMLSASLFATGQKSYTILYLIPFDKDSYTAPFVKECEDMERVKSYGLMGFWNGSQMAIEEYGDRNDVTLNIIVRDVTNSEAKLRAIMNNGQLMGEVDLIIGPFFSKLFTVAAEYAKQYDIPIVNPFTTRSGIVQNNEYVFKPMTSPEAQPAMLSFIAQQNNAFPIIVYGDSNAMSREWNVCKKYFAENKIPYYASANVASVVAQVQPGKKQIMLCFDDNSAKSLLISRSLAFGKKNDDLTFVVPESWLDSKTYDIEYYSQLNLHFFSNYYIDYTNEKTKVFIYDYTQRYGVPPMLKSFSYQGYDITKFFIEYLINDKDIDRVKVNPIALPMSFDKTSDGGYENVNLQFLEILDNEIVPSGY